MYLIINCSSDVGYFFKICIFLEIIRITKHRKEQTEEKQEIIAVLILKF